VSSLRGQLLIATPALLDPNFQRTAVLVAEHGEQGAMGLVLNRPSPTAAIEVVPQLDAVLEPHAPVYVGGPVQPTSIMVLAEFDDPQAAGLIVLGQTGFLSADDELDEAASRLRRARVFAGYSGWGAEQLDGELAREDWIVAETDTEDVFSADPETLWSAVLERKGGRYALLARMPLDVSVN
jgi:putative transcriptional regulator